MARAKQALEDLDEALETGNVADATGALAELQRNAPAKARAVGGSANDKFATLSQALDNGDLGKARTAFTGLKKALNQRSTIDDPTVATATREEPRGDRIYDKRDADKDGTVTWTENLSYTFRHPHADEEATIPPPRDTAAAINVVA